MEVKNIQNYFFLFVFFTVALVGGEDKQGCVVLDSLAVNKTTSEVVPCFSDYSPSDSDLFLPRRTSTPNAVRLNSTVKRTNNIYKNNFEFIKAGRVINICVGNFIQKESLTFNSVFINLDKRFIKIGKLII